MKEVAGATALMLDASGIFILSESTPKEAYLTDLELSAQDQIQPLYSSVQNSLVMLDACRQHS